MTIVTFNSKHIESLLRIEQNAGFWKASICKAEFIMLLYSGDWYKHFTRIYYSLTQETCSYKLNTRNMWLSLWSKRLENSSPVDLRGSAWLNSKEMLISEECQCLLKAVSEVLFQPHGPLVQANSGILSVHLLGFIVRAEISWLKLWS